MTNDKGGVFIGVPCMSGAIEAQTSLSITQAITAIAGKGFKVHYQHWVGDSILSNARNVLLGMFLQSRFEKFLMWDGDVVADPEQTLRLIGHEQGFVAGVPRFKTLDEQYPVTFLPGELWTTEDGLLEVKRAPLGFAVLTRDAAEKLVAHVERPYRCHLAPEVQCYAVFETPFLNGDIVGEDYLFCDRMREAGIGIWVDPYLELGHVGKHNFTGCLRDFMVKPKLDKAKYDKLFAEALGEAAE